MGTNFPEESRHVRAAATRAENRTGNLDRPARHRDENEMLKKPLQFKVPETVFNEFSRRAHEDFGHQKGAKLNLFMEMWRVYQK